MQNNKDVEHQEVKMYCVTNKIPEFQFLGPHKKPHVVRGLGKHYHVRFDPKIGHGACAMHHTPCGINMCTSMLENPWVTGMTEHQQPRYQPIKYCTYWPVLGYFNKWNILQLSLEATYSEKIDKTHQVVLYGIIDNMASLLQTGRYCAINTIYKTTMG